MGFDKHFFRKKSGRSSILVSDIKRKGKAVIVSSKGQLDAKVFN